MRARALDGTGRVVDEPVNYDWSLEGSVGALEDVAESTPTGDLLYCIL